MPLLVVPDLYGFALHCPEVKQAPDAEASRGEDLLELAATSRIVAKACTDHTRVRLSPLPASTSGRHIVKSLNM